MKNPTRKVVVAFLCSVLVIIVMYFLWINLEYMGYFDNNHKWVISRRCLDIVDNLEVEVRGDLGRRTLKAWQWSHFNGWTARSGKEYYNVCDDNNECGYILGGDENAFLLKGDSDSWVVVVGETPVYRDVFMGYPIAEPIIEVLKPNSFVELKKIVSRKSGAFYKIELPDRRTGYIKLGEKTVFSYNAKTNKCIVGDCARSDEPCG